MFYPETERFIVIPRASKAKLREANLLVVLYIHITDPRVEIYENFLQITRATVSNPFGRTSNADFRSKAVRLAQKRSYFWVG